MKKVIWLLCLLVLLIPQITALSLSGQKLGVVVFEPGKVITNHYEVTGTSLDTKVSVGSEFFDDYMRVEQTGKNTYELIIEFPNAVDIPPGRYPVSISASELPSGESQGINSLVSVGKRFHVDVYTYEKEISASFNVLNVNEDMPLDFSIGVQSRTYSDIESVQGFITVYDWLDHEIATLDTDIIALPSLVTSTLTTTLDTVGLDPGNYWAKARVVFDGESKILNDTFKIGNMDVVLKSYSEELNLGFSNFEVTVENNWGNNIKDVYAKLFIDGVELLHTPSIDLEAWGQGTLQGIVKVDLNPGVYPAEVGLFFSGESKTEDIFITIIDAPTPKEVTAQLELEQKNRTILYLVIALAVFILVVLTFIVKKWKARQDEF